MRGTLTRAFAGSGGRSNAIKAKCLNCCHFDRDAVTNCTVILCPLHAFRPAFGQSASKTEAFGDDRRAGISECHPAAIASGEQGFAGTAARPYEPEVPELEGTTLEELGLEVPASEEGAA